jgi:hypothetical protein
MKKLAAVLCVGLMASTASATLIVDNFEADHSGNYTILDDSNAPSGDGTADSTYDFQYDYVAAGIPLAPHSTGGDHFGLRMTANDTAGAADHVSAFYNTPITGKTKLLQVDIYMNVTVGGSGTTEFSAVGVGSDATDFNSIFTPIAGDGYFLSMTGDGGSSSDFRHFINGTPVNSGDPSYLNSSNTTNATGDTYQSIFPGGDFPGSPGNRWTTLQILVQGGKITYSLDGTPIIQADAGDTSGHFSLSYSDVFASIASPFQGMFVVYDNLKVVPEPASMSLLAMGALALLRRRR